MLRAMAIVNVVAVSGGGGTVAIGRIGNYEILERIGEGGMGIVFKAHDRHLLRTVALKILPERLQLDREYHERLLHEARALAAVSNHHIAMCHECSEGKLEPPDLLAPGGSAPHSETVDYIVMEYVPGQDLRARIASGVLPLPEVVRLAVQIASGVDAAHQAGVIHRDLTPANVRITPAGEIKILDFGLARSSGRPESRSTVSTSGAPRLAGTLGYMAPEQAAGRALDARTDLFSFGVILYQMVTGHLPFEGTNTLEVFYAIANVSPHPLSRYAAQVPTELQRIVDKLLEKAPEDRYQSAHEVHTDLLRLHETVVQNSRPNRPPLVPATIQRTRRTRPWAIVASVVVVILLFRLIWPRPLPALTEARCVAVMDFSNATGQASLDGMCAGLAPDLVDALSQRTDLTVSHSPAKDAMGRSLDDPGDVARELGVGNVVTGDVAATRKGPVLRLAVLRFERGRASNRRTFSIETPNSYPSREAVVAELVRLLRTDRVPVRLDVQGPAAHPSQEAYEAYLSGLGQFEELDEPLARDRALASFDRALAADSGLALAWAGRARALCWLHDRAHDPALLRLAAQASARAVALEPDLVQAHLAKARTDRLAGRVAEASQELRRVLALNPNLDDACRELGAVLKRTDTKQAADSYRRAVEIRPAYWINWKGLGDCLLMTRGDPAGARAAYLKVIELDPASNRGYEGLGNSYLAEGKYADAVSAYRRMPRPVTSSSIAANIANAYFFLRQLSPALQYYLMAASLEPDDPAFRQNLGDCYRRMGKEPEAHQQYLEAVKLHRPALSVDPASPKLRVQMAVYFAKAAECDSAAVWLDAAERVLPADNAELFHELAKAHALCGHHSEAIVSLRKMVRLGSSAGMLRDEDEFRDLRAEPEFQRLLGGT